MSRPHVLRKAPRSAAADVRAHTPTPNIHTLYSYCFDAVNRYSLKSMKLLIELLSNGNEDVQEQASCAPTPNNLTVYPY